MLTTGQNAPLFSLPTDQGSFNMADHHGKNVIIFFFPKAGTSGALRKLYRFLNSKPSLRPLIPLSSAFQKTRLK